MNQQKACLHGKRRRRYKLLFSDGDIRWSKLRSKHSRVELITPCADVLEAARPYYIGSTDPGCARAWVSKSLREALPLSVGSYYMVVGGLSGFDTLAELLARQRPQRIVLFDRDEGALDLARLMIRLVALCASRAALLHAIFGRCPSAWQSAYGPLTAETMLDYLRAPVDEPTIASVRRALPSAHRPLYDTIVKATAYGIDTGDRHEAGMVGLPMRRVWPCWGMRRDCPPHASGLCGGGHETFHYNEVGWLGAERSYILVREALCGSESVPALPVSFERIDLGEMTLPACQPATVSGGRAHARPHAHAHVVYMSNADQSAKFLPMGRQGVERQLGESIDENGERSTVLLVSTLALSRVCGEAVELIMRRAQPGERPWDERREERPPPWTKVEGVAKEEALRKALQALRRHELHRCLERDDVALDQSRLNHVLQMLHE